MHGTRKPIIENMFPRSIDQPTYLVSKTLLLKVQGRASERGTLGSGGEDRSPGRESALHGYGNKLKKGLEEEGDKENNPTQRETGWEKKGWRKLERDEAKANLHPQIGE
jgi:hypothetical protein